MDKLPSGDIKQKSGFLRWLDNFWYHNKVITIIAFFVIFVIVVCVVQMMSNEKEDVTILYSGPYLMTSTEREGVRNVFNTVMPEDYNGDGKKYTDIITYQVMSEEQLKELAAETHDGGETVSVDSYYYSKEYESYSNLLLTGECSVYLVDPWLYESLLKNNRLAKLDGVSGSAASEYAVRLGDTEIYKYYQALQVLPEDTLICLLLPYIYGQSSNEKVYEQSKDMLAAIINFKPPLE